MKSSLKNLLMFLLAGSLLFSITACQQSTENGSGNGDYSEIYNMIKAAQNQQYDDERQVKSFNDGALQEFDGIGGGEADASNSSIPPGEALRSATTADNAVESEGGGYGGDDTSEFSDTNNQVEGVQESDIVKTDGNFIYITNSYSPVYSNNGDNNGKVSVIKPDKGEMELVASLTLSNASPTEMLLYKEKLIIIWSRSEYFDTSNSSADNSSAESRTYDYDGGWSNIETVVQVYDTNSFGQGDSPVPVASYSQKGSFSSSRMVENNIYLITTFNPNIPQNFEEGDIECYIPSFTENSTTSYVAPTGIKLPENLEYIQYTVIGGLDVNNTDMAVSVKANLGYAGVIYSSLENIYVTRTVHKNIENQNWRSKSYTSIDRYSLDKGTVEFRFNGEVEGNSNNQFFFDEHKGILRVVTEKWGWNEGFDYSNPPQEPDPDWYSNTSSIPEYDNSEDYDWEAYNKEWEKIYNEVWGEYNEWWSNWGLQGASLYTLDSELNVLAEIHGIGKGENVQSVRFMGDVGYIVTFLNTDPLFSFDLSDPTNPKQLDELKIPGFSRYMHKWNDGLLLGMGVDANEENGQRTGLKLSMFDVSNNEDLSERHVYVIGGNSYYSPVENDHKAVLVAPNRNIIGYPYSGYDGDGYSGNRKSVYAVFSYGDDGFRLIGEIKIDSGINLYGNYYDGGDFQRGLYIDDYIYAVSNGYIVSAKLNEDSLEQMQTLELWDFSYAEPPYYGMEIPEYSMGVAEAVPPVDVPSETIDYYTEPPYIETTPATTVIFD